MWIQEYFIGIFATVNRGNCKNSMRSADLVEDGGLQSLSASSSNYYLTFFNLPRPATTATATATTTATA